MKTVHPNLRHPLPMLLVLLAVSALSAEGGAIWLPVARSADARTPTATFALDGAALEAALARAPRELSSAARESPAVVELPKPDGSVAEFRIELSPILTPGLAARYPELRTYAVREVEGTGHGRLSRTRDGIQALILSERGAFQIVPTAVPGEYVSFWESAAVAEPIECGVSAGGSPELSRLTAESGLRARGAAVTSGATLREYRVAVATTGEYYAGRGGSDESVLGSIMTELDKVDAIYENDVAVRFVLIDETDQLFFTDGTTDGYSNADPCSMWAENQAIVPGILTDDLYDVSIVFGTSPGGGCAKRGVCVSGGKASGAAGLNVGLAVGHENFGGYRLVAHEMGHQFGAAHTWSGSQGNCTGGQFSASTAWEPGGGTTLMSYSGTCGSDNIQSQVEDTYFHIGSIDQIVDYTTNGEAADCPLEIATGNSQPAVDAGADFTIPRQTPFVLTGDADDADGDSLAYTWEQFDVAAGQGPPNVDDGVGPLFRSFPPGPNPARTLPQLSDLLANTTTAGELLPSVEGRIMTFRLTARDNRSGGGGVNDDTAVITVEGDPFFLLQPNGGETLHAGCSTYVTWEVGGGSIVDEVNLLLSSDGGSSFDPWLADVANDGAESGTLPCPAAAQARVKAEAVGNIFFDISDADFGLVAEPPAIEAEAEGGEVDEACTFTVQFEATVEDDCAVAAQDVEVAAEVLTDNATLGTPAFVPTQENAATVSVTGSIQVSDLTGSPATVRITVSAPDACGYEASAHADADVADTLPPTISVELSPSILWPPNHKLAAVTADVEVHDNCPGVQFALTALSSDEPDDAAGGGDGNTTGDIQNFDLGTADIAFLLRAERLGAGDGRTYTATYVATDGSGNEAQAQADVSVPHMASVFKP
jgi:reprolysin-like metallo-peptidase family M12B